MIQITALPAFDDNYIWLLQMPERQRCAVVDPGDSAPVLAWLDAHPGWQLSDILITHHHGDHTGGVLELKARTGARVLGPALENIPARDVSLTDGLQVEILGLDWQVLHVPGHTAGHIALYSTGSDQPLLFCGDTLFAAGCGRLFEGTAAQMHASLQRLAALPPETRIYCTHEYTLSNLRFALAVEANNPELQQRQHEAVDLRARGLPTLPSNLAVELATNPFLRVKQPAIQQACAAHAGTELATAEAVFAELRSWKDNFR